MIQLKESLDCLKIIVGSFLWFINVIGSPGLLGSEHCLMLTLAIISIQPRFKVIHEYTCFRFKLVLIRTNNEKYKFFNSSTVFLVGFILRMSNSVCEFWELLPLCPIIVAENFACALLIMMVRILFKKLRCFLMEEGHKIIFGYETTLILFEKIPLGSFHFFW